MVVSATIYRAEEVIAVSVLLAYQENIVNMVIAPFCLHCTARHLFFWDIISLKAKLNVSYEAR